MGGADINEVQRHAMTIYEKGRLQEWLAKHADVYPKQKGEDEDEASVADQSAGVIDGGVDDVTPVQIWDEIMKKYKVAQMCEDEIERLEKIDKQDKKACYQQRQALAVAAAVEALGRLHSKDLQTKLRTFVEENRVGNVLTIPHSDTFLRRRDPVFWYSCFVRIFPRGD